MLLMSAGCTETSWLDITIPDEATKKYQGHPFSSFSRQTSIEYKKEYPDVSIITNIEEALNLKKGWVECSYGGEDWDDFHDLSVEKPRYIFQRLKVWKTEDNDRQIFVSLRYYVDEPKGTPKMPLNSLQFVTIIESVKPWYHFWEYSDDICES